MRSRLVTLVAVDLKASLSGETVREDSSERLAEGTRRPSGKHRGDDSAERDVDVVVQMKRVQLDDRLADMDSDPSHGQDNRRVEKSSRRRRQTSPGETRSQNPPEWEEKSQRDKERVRVRESSSKGSGQNRKSQAEDDREPAWMQAYDPEKDGKLAGALGGEPSNGQLDSIQAWKRELRAKENQESASGFLADNVLADDIVKTQSVDSTAHPEGGTQQGPIDEIAMFKLMMQREQTKGNGVNDVGNEATSIPAGWTVDRDLSLTDTHLKDGSQSAKMSSGKLLLFFVLVIL